MPKKQILVIDDDADIRELISYNLTKNGFAVSSASSGEAALERLRNELPDLIILDLMLPGMDGLDICRKLRQAPRTAALPIIMLTARDEDADIVTGLELGADDYVIKPFSPRVLIARIRATLRQGHQPLEEESGAILQSGNLVIDPGRRRLQAGTKEIHLTYTEFNILYFLMHRPEWVYSRQQIIDAIRDDEYPVTARSVDVQIASLRKKLGDAGKRIETIRGVGYCFR